MRTALLLLFLLAVAAIPGSLFPQRGNSPLRVKQWLDDRPGLGQVLDRLGFFDVYASPWFAAIYLLLFISLVGCLLPRSRQYWAAARRPPPDAPRRMERMPGHTVLETGDSESTLADLDRELRRKRWRTRRGADQDGRAWLAAEKGYLHDAGNLLFHGSLVVVLVAVAISGLFGWKGNVIVREGSSFANVLTQFDAWGGGRFFDPSNLSPYAFTLDQFSVDFQRGDVEAGTPLDFLARTTYWPAPGEPSQRVDIRVNEPLVADGAKVFLVGHGYAPRFTIRDPSGRVVFDDTVPFLPQDSNMTSTGVVKVPDASPQLGFTGIFAPTAALSEQFGPYSTFPAADDPAVFLAAFRGDLGLDGGAPQSIYSLETSAMEQIGLEALRVGQTWDLPGGAGSITFAGWDRWASFQIANDPGKELALGAAVAALAGLIVTLSVRKRRVWLKVLTDSEGQVMIEVAGLTKTNPGEAPVDLEEIARRVADSRALDSTPA